MAVDQQALAILATFAAEQRLPFGLVVATAFLESRLDVNAIGDGGLACGIIQVRSDVHGRDCAWWSGYEGAARSLALMGARWRVAFQRLGDGWTDATAEGRALYLGLFQPAAQGSEVPSSERCREAVRMAASVEIPEQEPTSMRVAQTVWQFDQDYPGVASNDATLPIDRMLVKTHDGANWMNTFDDHPEAVNGPDQIRQLVTLYADQGIRFVPWFVPTGRAMGTEQAMLTQVVQVLPDGQREIWFNVEREDTPYFWKGTPDELVALANTARRAAPDVRVVLWCYQYGAEFGFPQVVDAFDAVATEDYWNDFGTTPEARLAFSARAIGPTGKPIIYGLPGNAPADEVQRALQWIAAGSDPKYKDVCVWRRGTTTRAVFDTIAAFDIGVVVEPTPEPETEQVTNLKAALAIDAGVFDAEALAAEGAARRLRSAAQGARDALATWG